MLVENLCSKVDKKSRKCKSVRMKTRTAPDEPMQYGNDPLAVLLLMSHLPQAFLPFVGCHFMTFPFFSARHADLLSVD
jgi:hypothetical protein